MAANSGMTEPQLQLDDVDTTPVRKFVREWSDHELLMEDNYSAVRYVHHNLDTHHIAFHAYDMDGKPLWASFTTIDANTIAMTPQGQTMAGVRWNVTIHKVVVLG